MGVGIGYRRLAIRDQSSRPVSNYRSSLPAEMKSLLKVTVASSLKAGLAQIPQIAAECATGAGIPAPVIEDYLNGISYELGPAEEEAKNFFRGMIEEARTR